METLSAILRDLSFDDLDQWAGGTIRSRGKSYIKRVDGLCCTPDNELVAWVSGNEEYATQVQLDRAGNHSWFCTCPYEGGPCKHAVAVVLAAAERVKRQEEIPLLDQEDDLYLILYANHEDDAEWADAEDDPPEMDPVPPPEKVKKVGKASVRKILVEKSREQLFELIVDLAGRYPEVERFIVEAEQLESGRIDPLVRSLRKEIKQLASEPAWYNHWNHEGYLPDYTHVREQLKAFLNQGHADVVLQLGDELWREGTDQVEQSDDEGQTGSAIAECLEVVLQAVPKSSLVPPQQLLWVIDRLPEDEFSLLESGEEVLKNGRYGQDHWREVAAVLETRLESLDRSRSSAFSDTHRRKEVMNRLIQAYQQSGWPEKILPLLEKEADSCRNYEQLVGALLEAGNRQQARQWCLRGFAQTRENDRGSAAGLQKRLREIALSEKQYDLVAAYRAQDFFEHSSLETYKELRKAVEKVGNWPVIRAAAQGFLESGHRPDLSAKGGKTTDWPLPEPEVQWPSEKKRGGLQQFPKRETLIDIAILEKRFDDVVEWYKTLKKSGRLEWYTDQKVARAVAESHPEVALAIWRVIVDGLIAQVKPKLYIEAGGYLRLMRKVYEANQRLADWQSLLAELRRTHKAKRRFLEVLDSLTDSRKKIIE